MTHRRSITLRLTLLFLTASTTVLLVLGYLVGSLVEAHFEQQDLMELTGKLELVRHAMAKLGNNQAQLNTLPAILTDALIGHHDLSVSVIGANGQILFASDKRVFPAAMLSEQEAKTKRAHPVSWRHENQTYRGISGLAHTGASGTESTESAGHAGHAAGPLAGRAQASAIVALALDIHHHIEFMAEFRKSLWLAIAAGIALTALLGWVAARRGLQPIREMAQVTHGISASRLGHRLPPESVPVELVDLALAFNDMLARLEDSFRRLSDSSSDLAHELRTPISNLMTQTQVVLSKTRSADEYREALYSNLEECEGLARMIADMLFLAKADNGLMVPSDEAVDLPVQVRELFGFYEAYAEQQGVELRLEGSGAIRGDRLMIRRALGNLLSNAIRHTPRGAAVHVRIARAASGATLLRLENAGDTIEAEHLPRLFDRFYRVDPSRQKTTEGVGLGLAITRSIIAAHKGTIEVASADGLTCFTLCFP